LVVDHEEVFMRFFVQTMEEGVRKLFRDLLVATIDTSEALEQTFMEQWR